MVGGEVPRVQMQYVPIDAVPDPASTVGPGPGEPGDAPGEARAGAYAAGSSRHRLPPAGAPDPARLRALVRDRLTRRGRMSAEEIDALVAVVMVEHFKRLRGVLESGSSAPSPQAGAALRAAAVWTEGKRYAPGIVVRWRQGLFYAQPRSAEQPANLG